MIASQAKRTGDDFALLVCDSCRGGGMRFQFALAALLLVSLTASFLHGQSAAKRTTPSLAREHLRLPQTRLLGRHMWDNLRQS